MSGQTHLELATYLNHASFGEALRRGNSCAPLSHVCLRFRRTTENAYGALTSKTYELGLREWHQAWDIAASNGHLSWWDLMNLQIWRSNAGVFIEVTRRLEHQGVYEASSIWSLSTWPSSPSRFIPCLPDASEL